MRQLALWVEERSSSCEPLTHFVCRLNLQVDWFLNLNLFIILASIWISSSSLLIFVFSFIIYYFLTIFFHLNSHVSIELYHFKLLNNMVTLNFDYFPLFNYCLLYFHLFTFYIFFSYTYQLGVNMYFSPSNQNSHYYCYYYYYDFLCFFLSFWVFRIWNSLSHIVF